MSNNNGGPAFPTNTHSGMSLRSYFAAHAPAVPEWFEPFTGKEPSIPPQLQRLEALQSLASFAALPEEDVEYVTRWCDADGSWNLAPRLHYLITESWDLIEAREIEIRRVKGLIHQTRFFKWRWHYADMMLATRGDA